MRHVARLRGYMTIECMTDSLFSHPPVSFLMMIKGEMWPPSQFPVIVYTCLYSQLLEGAFMHSYGKSLLTKQNTAWIHTQNQLVLQLPQIERECLLTPWLQPSAVQVNWIGCVLVLDRCATDIPRRHKLRSKQCSYVDLVLSPARIAFRHHL